MSRQSPEQRAPVTLGLTLCKVHAKNKFCHQTIRTSCQAISESRVHVEPAHFEINDRVNVVLLFIKGQKASERAERRIIFHADRKIFAELAGKARGRQEFGIPQ